MTGINQQKEIVPDNYKLLISEQEIQKRITEISTEISKDFTGEKPILIMVDSYFWLI